MQTMRHFASLSGSAFAQFPLYSVYPGTKDYHEMIRDWKNRDNPDYKPKHAVQIVAEKYWLDYDHTDVAVKHPSIASEDLLKESQESWSNFYSLKEIMARTRSGPMSTLPLPAKIFYAVTCRVFASLYPGGIAADNVRKAKLGIIPRLSMRAAMRVARRDYDWGIRPQRREVIEEIIDMAA
jgi:hypothetical protein